MTLHLVSLERERDDKRDGIAGKLDKLSLGSKCLSSRSIEGGGYVSHSLILRWFSQATRDKYSYIRTKKGLGESLSPRRRAGNQSSIPGGDGLLYRFNVFLYSFLLSFFLTLTPRESCICGIFKNIARKQRKRDGKTLSLQRSSNDG